MKKKIYTLSVLLAAVLPAGAQSIKSDINTVLERHRTAGFPRCDGHGACRRHRKELETHQ